jgi:hypothetical protein
MSKPLAVNPNAALHLPERGMSESRYTPTPWRVDERDCKIISGEDFAVCSFDYSDADHSDVDEANASFIVTACNSYAAMKAALMGIVARPDIQPDDGTELPPWLRRVYDALAKAEGKV